MSLMENDAPPSLPFFSGRYSGYVEVLVFLVLGLLLFLHLCRQNCANIYANLTLEIKSQVCSVQLQPVTTHLVQWMLLLDKSRQTDEAQYTCAEEDSFRSMMTLLHFWELQ